MDQTTPKVGTILNPEDNQRDAIHFALAPVVCGDEELEPGREIGLNDNGEATTYTHKRIGIVDPFLKYNVKKGERFYLFLFPGTITSLRHSWTHPAFTAMHQTKVREIVNG